MAEALRRAEAYHMAGADAILIHSKRNTADEIVEFMKEWGSISPVVIVPTMYYDTPTEVFEELGVSVVIWANHILRASIKAMKDAAAQIYESRSISALEPNIVTVKEIFRLQNADELKQAEKRYLSQPAQFGIRSNGGPNSGS
jgi:phosphoenolpyruvate phosphomutase